MSQTRPAFIGIDVAFAKGKRLPICICTWEGRCLMPVPLRDLEIEPPRGAGNALILNESLVKGFADRTASYISNACAAFGLQPERIAIDAPRTPRRAEMPRRAAEVAMDAVGINCFATPSRAEFESIRAKVRSHLAYGGPENRIPHANQLWMLVGFALFKRLNHVAPCLEVFPQATARALDAGRVHKSKSEGLKAQLAAVASHTGWPLHEPGETPFGRIAWGLAHDCLDAYLAAWVAALSEEDRIPLGEPPDDVIWVPSVGNVPARWRARERLPDRLFVNESALARARRPHPGPPKPNPHLKREGEVRHAYPCPIAGCEKVFHGSRGGWDAHVGSIRAHPHWHPELRDPVARKQRFRAEFAAWFV